MRHVIRYDILGPRYKVLGPPCHRSGPFGRFRGAYDIVTRTSVPPFSGALRRIPL
jgi:hypothetical protein